MLSWPDAIALMTALVLVATFATRAVMVAKLSNGNGNYAKQAEFVELRADVKHLQRDFEKFDRKNDARWVALYKRLDRQESE